VNGGPTPLRGKPHEWGWKKENPRMRTETVVGTDTTT